MPKDPWKADWSRGHCPKRKYAVMKLHEAAARPSKTITIHEAPSTGANGGADGGKGRGLSIKVVSTFAGDAEGAAAHQAAEAERERALEAHATKVGAGLELISILRSITTSMHMCSCIKILVMSTISTAPTSK